MILVGLVCILVERSVTVGTAQKVEILVMGRALEDELLALRIENHNSIIVTTMGSVSLEP
jgi:hypothetical protein